MNKKNLKLILIIFTLIAILVRLYFFPYESGDYKWHLKYWIEQIIQNNGIFSLKKKYWKL